MRPIFSFLFLFATTLLFAQSNNLDVVSKIEKVTVFKNGAQITRKATHPISKGKSTLKFIKLAPYFDTKSLQLKAKGDFTVLAVQTQIKKDTQNTNTNNIAFLAKSNDSLKMLIEELTIQAHVFSQEEQLILNNNKPNKSSRILSIEELKAMADFYQNRLRNIKLAKLKIERQINNYHQKVEQQEKQINEIKERISILEYTEVLVSVLAKNNENGDFELNYLVGNAGWIPTYDLRVKDVQSPIDLAYKANVFQNSGEDWKDVELTLSNANPKQSAEKPQLQKWNLGFYSPKPIYAKKHYGQDVGLLGITYNNDGSRTLRGRLFDTDLQDPLIGASIIIVGTTFGTTTDIDGVFELTIPTNHSKIELSYTGFSTKVIDLTNTYNYAFTLDEGVQLDEVVVTGYASKNRKARKQEKAASQPVETITQEKTTSVEFKIKEPYTINKDGKQYMVNIQNIAVPAYYEYYCAPKLEEDVFLTAMVTDWEAYNLLSGETNLYFEGTFLGNAQLNVESLQDTLSWSLGRDKNVVVKRTVQKDYTKKQFIGNKKYETKSIVIEVRNKKKVPINLIIEDQFPTTTTSSIEVKVGNYSKNAKLDTTTKILEWALKLAPNQMEKLTFDYGVKYPKNKRLILN